MPLTRWDTEAKRSGKDEPDWMGDQAKCIENVTKLWVYGSTDLPGGVSSYAVADDSWTEEEAA
ncbi:hypothetical protein J27TS7_38690 [Paenibacillus dendritiformis]|uniref:hypothetical protein n=1 Tax=Paenibacillus dendritiformis TaxID=130049 RepID=UPI001B0CF0A9|nr:hypothetical protein [Paenibacillus dendritiformis]GIO74355.1 hypothetical protein J27TS7_38690 [Paenibacillus dendritiformis]